jgi:hypothetical protein
MKSLFDPKNESFTEAAIELDSRASELLSPLISEFVSRGYPAREIESVLVELARDFSFAIRSEKEDPLEGEGPDGFGRKR